MATIPHKESKKEQTYGTDDTSIYRNEQHCMHIAEQDTGPLVLLLHGFPEVWYSWRHQLAALADAGYHVVAPDQRGYGQTDRPAKSVRYTHLHLVGDVIGLTDALGEETAIVAGHDWGSIDHLEYGAPTASVVRSHSVCPIPLVAHRADSRLHEQLWATAPNINYFQKPGVAEAEFERDIRKTMRKFLYTASGDAPQGEQLALVIPEGQGMLDCVIDPKVLPTWLTETDLNYYTTAFERTGFTGGLNWYRMIDKSCELMAAWHEAIIAPPVLFIAGDRDPVVSSPSGQRQIAKMQRFIPNLKATLLLLGGGHWIQQERPLEVSAAMIEFMRGL